jgi:hypothetical protein
VTTTTTTTTAVAATKTSATATATINRWSYMASRMQKETNSFEMKTSSEFIPLQIYGSCL